MDVPEEVKSLLFSWKAIFSIDYGKNTDINKNEVTRRHGPA